MVLTGVNAKTTQSRTKHKRYRINGNNFERSDLSQIYCGNDEIHAAIEHYKKLFTINTKGSVVNSGLAEAPGDRGEVKQTPRQWEESLKAEQLCPKVKHNLAAIHQSSEKPELAIAKWQEVLRSDTNNADALFHLGEYYEKIGECIKAVECYQRYVKVVLPEKCRANLAKEKIQHLCKVIRAVYSSNI
jgi:tetratricopeptide (TPR) repeat protein